MVPEEISEWNPLIAPQAMVMKQNGKIFPAKTGPLPSMNRVSGGIIMWGRTNKIAGASDKIAPVFMNALRSSRGARSSQTGRTAAAKPYAIVKKARDTPPNVKALAQEG